MNYEGYVRRVIFSFRIILYFFLIFFMCLSLWEGLFNMNGFIMVLYIFVDCDIFGGMLFMVYMFVI